MKRFHWEQDQIAHMKVELSSCSPGELDEGIWGIWGSGKPEDVVIRVYPTFRTSRLAPARTPSPLCGLFQNYIARFGHGSAKLARQAQSKEKTLQKMMASGLTERVVSDKVGSAWVKLVACGVADRTQPNLISTVSSF